MEFLNKKAKGKMFLKTYPYVFIEPHILLQKKKKSTREEKIENVISFLFVLISFKHSVKSVFKKG